MMNIFDAIRSNEVYVVDYLLGNKSVERNLTDENGKSLAVVAASECDTIDIMVLLVEYKISCINIPDNDGNTPLYLAISKNTVEMVEYLMLNGANSNYEKIDGETMVNYAIKKGNKYIMHLLRMG